MREKLLPCPFCGNHPAISDETTAWDSNDAEQDAIWKWNNRVCPKEVQEAIEKQKPKKPQKDIVHYRCPNYDAMLNTYETCNFCNYCGQKLDWSEE